MAERVLTVKIIGNSQSLERSFRRSSTAAGHFDKNLSRATRGALAGSGVFRSLGRSIAFASGGFLAFASAGQFLRTSVDAAKEAQVVQKQLGAQFRASGQDLAAYQAAIDKTANRLSLLAGIENDEVKAGFTTIFRTTGNVTKSLRDTATAADLARAKHLSFAQASLIVAKTEAGNTTLLRRQGFQIAKNATAEQALATLRRVVAGQARAGTTAQERFGAVLHNTEEIIGTGILPVLNKYLTRASVWLTQMNDSGRLQRDVNEAVKTTGEVVGGLKDVLVPAIGAFKSLGVVVGGTRNEVKLLGIAFLVLKTRAKLTGLGLIGTEIAGIGTKSLVTAGQVSTLTTRLGVLAKLGAAGIILNFIPTAKKNPNPNAPSNNPVAQFFAGLPFVGGVFSQANRVADALAKAEGLTPSAAASSSKVKRAVGITPAQAALKQTFEQAKLLNPKLTRKAFELGQAVARAFLAGTNKPPAGSKRTGGSKGLSLAGQFNLAELKLAQAQLTKTTADDVKQLRVEAAIVRLQIEASKTLKDRTAKTQQLGGILQQIASLTVSAEVKAGKAVKKHTDDWVKLGGAIQAIPHDMRAIVTAAKELGSETAFQRPDLSKILAGLGLDPAQFRAVRGRLSQVGAGGTVPGRGIGAFGFAQPVPAVVHTHVYVDGKEIAPTVTRHQQKASRRNPSQRRGPHAGG